MAVHPWGKTSAGHPVASVILTNGPLTVEIITLGAAIRDMRLAGHAFPLVLGLNSVAEYQNHGLYFGAVVGRFANRIAGARFQLDGTTYELPENDNGSVLHGGAGGFSSRVWDIDDVSERHVTLTLESPDGDMGFAAAVTARCTYALSEAGVLDVTLEATSDAPTVCAMAQHAYFNLEDGGASSVHSHDLQVQAEAFLQRSPRLIKAEIVVQLHEFQLTQSLK
ncbi:MAG: galactose-1-epimerase, partial [Pseudomonadota bacterium]